MTREEAIRLLKEYVKNERMLNHCYASEAVMRALAQRLGRDEEKWAIAGLLHERERVVPMDSHCIQRMNEVLQEVLALVAHDN
jgi:predicted hydrolase (HD superfamily)